MSMNGRSQAWWIELAAVVSAVNMLVSPVAQAASRWWDGSDDASWNTVANWSTVSGGGATPSAVPGAYDAITFNASGTINNQMGTLGGNQSVNGITFNSGVGVTIANNTLTLGSGGITLNGADTDVFNCNVTLSGGQSWNNGGGTVTVGGTVTRNVGAAVDFNATGTFNGAGLLAAVNTAVQGWATMGGSWVISDGSKVSSTVTYTANTWASGNNTDVTANSSPASGSTTGSLRFNTAGAYTVTLAGNNIISTGGILVTSTVGNSLSKITGGTLEGASGKDLVIIQNNTANNLRIESTIADNTSATALTKSGTGTLQLMGNANTYSGGTFINAGMIYINNNGSLGTGTITMSGGRIDVVQNPVSIANNMTIQGDATLTTDTAGGTHTFSGNITFAQGLSTLTIGNAQGDFQMSGNLTLHTDYSVVTRSNQTANAYNLVFGASGKSIAWTAPRRVTLNYTFSGAGANIFRGALDGNANTLTLAGTAPVTFGDGTAAVSGTCGGVVVNGPTVTFGSANSFTGGVTLQAGTLNVNGNTSGSPGSVTSGPVGTGTFTLSGGTFAATLANPRTFANAIKINGTSTMSFSGTSNSDANLQLSGDTTFASGLSILTLNSGNSSDRGRSINFTGNLNLGTDFTVNGAMQSNDNKDHFVLGASGKNITFSANRQLTFSLTHTGSALNIIRGVLDGGANTLTLAGTSPITFGDAITAISGTCGGIVVNGPTVTFGGANSFAGGVKVQSGIAKLSNATGFGTGTLTLAGGTVQSGGAYTQTNPWFVTGAATADTASGNLTVNANANFQAPPAGGTLLTKNNNNTLTFSGGGMTMGVRLNGGAELLTVNSFTLVNKTAGTLTDNSTWESATMWTKGGTGGTTITATLAAGAKKDTIGGGSGSATFAATALGYVQLDGLVSGTLYQLTLNFAGSPSLATIQAQLQAAHPSWTAFSNDGVSKISFAVTSPVTGSAYLGWDNTYSSLGADVKGVAVLPALPAIANVAVTSKGADYIDFPYNLSSTGAAPTRVSLYWGPNTHSQTGWENTNHLAGFKTAGSASVHVGSLASGTTYYYQFRASNEYGIVWAPDTLFAATSAGLVNDPVSSRTYSGATLNGTLGDTGGGTVDVIVHWGTNNLGETTSGWDGTHTFAGQSAGPSGLALSHAATTVPDRVYYYKFRMTNETLHTGSWAPTFTTFNTYAAHIAASGSPSEDGTPGTFTISRVAAALGASWTVNFALTGGAGNGTDYVTVSPLSVTLGAAETSKTVSIVPIYDGVADAGDVAMELTTVDPATVLLEPGQEPMAIADYLVPISVTAADGVAIEASADDGRFTISRPALGTNAAVTVNYTLGGTASNGTDYALSPAGTSVTLGVGRTSTNIAVDAKADFVIDDGETVSLTLAAGLYTIQTPGPVTVAITDRPPVYWYDKQDGNFTANTTWTNSAGVGGHPVAGDLGVIDSQTVTVTGSEDPSAAIELSGGTLYNNTANLINYSPVTVGGSATIQFGQVNSPNAGSIAFTLAGSMTFAPGLTTLTVNSPRTSDYDADVKFTGDLNLNTDFTVTGTLGGQSSGANDVYLGAAGKNINFGGDRVVTIDTPTLVYSSQITKTIFAGALVGGANTMTLAGTTDSLEFGHSGGAIAGTCGGVIVDGPTVTFGSANSFTGGVTLQAGTLVISGSSTGNPVTSGPVGTGVLTLSGGKLRITATSATISNELLIDGSASIEYANNGNGTKAFDATVTFAPGLGTLTVSDVNSVANDGRAFSGHLNLSTDFTVAGTFQASASLVFGASGKNLTFGSNRQLTFGNTFGTGANVLRGMLAGGTATLTLAGTAPVAFGDGTAAVSGTCGGVVFNGPTITLAAANSYAGGTTVAGGWVRVGNNAGFAAGALRVDGGKVSSADFSSRTIANALTIGGSCTLGAINTGALTFTGNKTFTAACTLTTAANIALNAGTLTATVGKPVTKDGAEVLTTGGQLNLALEGSMDLVTNVAVRVITRSEGTLTDTMTIQGCGGLWTKSSDANKVDAVLGNLTATMAYGETASFGEQAAGHVAITGLTAGQVRQFAVRLASFDSGKNAASVAAELRRNPRFTSVTVDSADSVSFKLVSPATGTAYLVWDNYSGSVNDLGANVTGLILSEKGTLFIFQ